MTRQISVGEIIPLHSGRCRVDDLLRGAVVVRPDPPLPANDKGADLGNIVPFTRPHGKAGAAPSIGLATEAARLPQARSLRERAWFAGIVMVSLSAHIGLFMALWRQPVPLASIGVEAVSVELILGASAPAGIAPTEGEQQVNAATAPETQATAAEKSEQKATAQPQAITVARQDAADRKSTRLNS